MRRRSIIQGIKIHQSVLWTVLITGLLIRLYLSWLSTAEMMNRFLFDDAFYYLQVARNIATGYGVTFDGVNLTNGFHPLWMLILVLLFKLVPANPDLVLHLALTLCSVFNVVTGYLIYRIVVKAFGYYWSAVMATLFWILHYPFVMRASLGGLETSLSAMMISVCIYAYLWTRERVRIERMSLLGLLLGLAFLARVDNIVLALAIAIDLLYSNRTRIAACLPAWTGAALTMGVMMAPWLIWSLLSSGRLLPTSGAALSYWGRYWRTSLFDPFNFLLTLKYAALGIQEYFWVFDFGMLGNLCSWTFREVQPVYSVAGAIVILSWAYLVRKKFWSDYRPFLFLIIYAVVLFSAYSILLRPDSRYMYPSFVITLVLGASLFEKLVRAFVLKRCDRWGRVLRIATGLLVAIYMGALVAYGVRTWKYNIGGLYPLHLRMYTEGVAWINKHTAPEDVIGSFNSGIYGFYSKRHVVNLDGVINNSAYQAIRDHTLFKYIETQNIRYLIEWGEEQVYFFLDNFGGDEEYRCRLVKIDEIRESDPRFANWVIVIFKVVEPGKGQCP